MFVRRTVVICGDFVGLLFHVASYSGSRTNRLFILYQGSRSPSLGGFKIICNFFTPQVMAYTTKSGDTWDVIAKQVYGSEYHADILMAANPQQIDTFLFEAGVVLATPVLEEERDGLLPPWKYEASYE